MAFVKATKKRAKARVAISGPSGSGKTRFALEVARELAGPNGRVAVRDSEHESASLYSDMFAFDTEDPAPVDHSPASYIKSIKEAAAAGFDVLVLDSLSHAWAGAGGILEQADAKGKRFDTWKDLTPQQNALVEAILAAPMHIICTMRSKTEWVLEKGKNKQGNEVTVPRKVGLAPVQREGLEYEFTVFLTADEEANITATKTRCAALRGKTWHHNNVEIAQILKSWLEDGEDVEAKKAKGRELSEALKATGVPSGEWLAWMAKSLGVPEVKGLGELSIADIDKLITSAKELKATAAPATSAAQNGAAA